jgi:hypothetical protein
VPINALNSTRNAKKEAFHREINGADNLFWGKKMDSGKGFALSVSTDKPVTNA